MRTSALRCIVALVLTGALVNPKSVLAVFLAVAAVWTAILLWVFHRRTPAPYADLAPMVARLRKSILYPLLIAALVLFVVSFRWLVFPAMQMERLGAPQVSVEVLGVQWAWSLSRREVPAGVPVEFRVAAQDVNHGFGIYDPQGRLRAQVQAMPRYTNRLIVRLDEPGTYVLRCLEYCGTAHHVMVTELTVR